MHNEDIVIVENISKKYGEFVALDDISFTVKKGEYIGLIGPNGAGKSTLLKILLGLEKATHGSVRFVQNVQVGYVPQDYLLGTTIPIAVYEVLGMATDDALNHAAHKNDYAKALTSVGLDQGLLNENFHLLSGGQKQRVIVARALMCDPDILFFDEPLSGVDLHAKMEIYDLLHEINVKNNITIVFVSHEIERIIKKCDRVLCLNKKIYKGCHPASFVHDEIQECKDEECQLQDGAIHHEHE